MIFDTNKKFSIAAERRSAISDASLCVRIRKRWARDFASRTQQNARLFSLPSRRLIPTWFDY